MVSFDDDEDGATPSDDAEDSAILSDVGDIHSERRRRQRVVNGYPRTAALHRVIDRERKESSL